MAGYYNPKKDYSKAIEAAKAAGKDTSRLEVERQNKINDKYGGKEPTMYGSNKTYSQASRGNDRDTIDNAISISNGRGSSSSSSNGSRNTGGNVRTPSNGRGSHGSDSNGNRVTNLPGNAQPAQATPTPLAPAQLPALNQYGYRDMDYTTAIQNATSAAERAQLMQERANKIKYQYDGVEPNMTGSNQKFSETLAGSSPGQASGQGAVGSTKELVKGPGYVTGGYTIGVNGSPILNDNPYWKGGVSASKADMSRRPDLANGYATSNGYTVFYDEDGYMYTVYQLRIAFSETPGVISALDLVRLEEEWPLIGNEFHATSGLTYTYNEETMDIVAKFGTAAKYQNVRLAYNATKDQITYAGTLWNCDQGEYRANAENQILTVVA